MAESSKKKRKARGIVGDVVIHALDNVTPNSWNPHALSPEKYESLKHGLNTDGWIAAQALVIWRTDETGAEQNVIIDGEHRWRAARELKMREGPMVFLDGLTRAQAMAHTIKFDSRRGAFVEDRLAAVYRELDAAPTPETAIDLGTSVAEIDRLLAAHPAPDLAGTSPAAPSDAGSAASTAPTTVPESRYKSQYAVVIPCNDEADQRAVYERAIAEFGRDCRVLTT